MDASVGVGPLRGTKLVALTMIFLTDGGASSAAHTYCPPADGQVLTISAREQASQAMPSDTKIQPQNRATGPPPRSPWAKDAIHPSH